MQTFFMDFVFLISIFYLRFFQNGFSEWEIVGIENCIYDWALDTYRFACEKWGEENVIGFDVHCDETSIHAHVQTVPVEQVRKRGRIGSKYIHKDNPEKVLSTKEWRALPKEERDNYTKSEAAKGVVERVISYAKVWGERAKDKSQYLSQLHTDYYNSVGHKYGLARCQRIHFCVIPLAKKFVLSMIVCIFAASVLAKPLNNAQIVRGVFCLYTFEYGESYSLYKTV